MSLIKQYMEQQWAVADAAEDVQQASHQDGCWDMSVLQACLADQQRTWVASAPQLMEAEANNDLKAGMEGIDASPQQDAIKLFNQVGHLPVHLIIISLSDKHFQRCEHCTGTCML